MKGSKIHINYSFIIVFNILADVLLLMLKDACIDDSLIVVNTNIDSKIGGQVKG